MDVSKRLKEIKIENFIWIIYIGIIALSYYSNYLEKKYFLYNDLKSKEEYRKIIVFIFFILVIIYSYFLKDSLDGLHDIDFNNISDEDELSILSFIASLLIFISGLIFLYISLKDDNLNVELAFN